MRNRKAVAVPLPKNVFRVNRGNGRFNYYWQERRGRPDHGPIHRLPDDPRDPELWATAARLNAGRDAEAKPAEGSVAALIFIYKEGPRFKALSEGSVETYGIALDHIATYLGASPVADLLPKHVYAMQDKMSDRPSMANLTIRVLRTMLKEAIKRGLTQINAASEIEPLDEEVIGAEPWPEAAFAYVLQHAPQLLVRAVVLGRATGQRAVDLIRMRPADRKDGGINFTIQKIGNVRHWTPIHSHAIAVIDKWRCEPMVPYLAPLKSPDALRSLWKAWKTEHPAVPADATLHDLRAMAVCDCRLSGVAHQQIADQLGMSPSMVTRYSKAIDKKANAEAGMRTMEQATNENMKRVWGAAETRG